MSFEPNNHFLEAWHSYQSFLQIVNKSEVWLVLLHAPVFLDLVLVLLFSEWKPTLCYIHLSK